LKEKTVARIRRERKTKRNGARKKIGTVPQKSPTFGLCACVKVKYCTFLHENFIKILLQGGKEHFWQSLGKFSTVAPKKINLTV